MLVGVKVAIKPGPTYVTIPVTATPVDSFTSVKLVAGLMIVEAFIEPFNPSLKVAVRA